METTVNVDNFGTSAYLTKEEFEKAHAALKEADEAGDLVFTQTATDLGEPADEVSPLPN